LKQELDAQQKELTARRQQQQEEHDAYVQEVRNRI
jgi:hypothetical protein